MASQHRTILTRRHFKEMWTHSFETWAHFFVLPTRSFKSPTRYRVSCTRFFKSCTQYRVSCTRFFVSPTRFFVSSTHFKETCSRFFVLPSRFKEMCSRFKETPAWFKQTASPHIIYCTRRNERICWTRLSEKTGSNCRGRLIFPAVWIASDPHTPLEAKAITHTPKSTPGFFPQSLVSI